MTIKVLQTNFSAGELDPDLDWRQDLQAYYNGASSLLNTLSNAAGKVFRAPGLRFRRRHRRVLEEQSQTGATITSDGSSIGADSPFVFKHFDFGAAVAIDFVDMTNIALSAGTLDDQMFVQWSADDATWTDFGGAFNLTADDRTRRRSSGEQVSARYWRIARVGTGTVSATLSVDSISFFRETATLSETREIRFAYDNDAKYMLIASDRNIDVWTRTDGLVGSIAIPHTSAQLGGLAWTQSLDTVLLFHPEVAPIKIFRQGSADEWDVRTQSFDNIPKYDYGAGVGGVDEVMRLKIIGDATATDAFRFQLEDQTTADITLGDSDHEVDFGEAVQQALRDLPNTFDDSITVEHTGTFTYTITFGGKDGKRPWQPIVGFVSVGNSFAIIEEITKGELPGEDVMSDTRGWPRCGCFHGQRLFLGGFKGLPDGWCGSVVGEFFNLDNHTDRVDRGFLRRIGSDQAPTIRQLYSAAHLLAFTDAGEYYQRDEPITPGNANMRGASKYGVREGVPVVECDGTPIFANGGGGTICEFGDTINSEVPYKPNELTLLASHLIDNPVDAASRLPSDELPMHVYAAVNADGSLAVLTSMREQNLTGWRPRVTQGKFLAVREDFRGDFWFVVERTLGGVTDRFIETSEVGIYTDCASTWDVTAEENTATQSQTVFGFDFDAPDDERLVGVRVDGVRLTYPLHYAVDLDEQTITLTDGVAAGAVVRIAQMVETIDGLERFNGASVWVTVDGTPLASQSTISDGELALAVPADTSIEIGLHYDVECAPMPVLSQLPDGTAIGDLKRIVEATVKIKDTAYFEVSANDDAYFAAPVRQLGPAINVAMRDAGRTGAILIDGLLGITRDGQLRLRQPRPLDFQIQSLRMEVAF